MNGVVYIGSYDGNVYALYAATGQELWHFTTEGLGIPPCGHERRRLIGSYDGNVYALGAATGEELWHFTTEWYVLSSPAVANGVVYVGSDDGNVYALNAATGEELWQFTTGGLLFPVLRS